MRHFLSIVSHVFVSAIVTAGMPPTMHTRRENNTPPGGGPEAHRPERFPRGAQMRSSPTTKKFPYEWSGAGAWVVFFVVAFLGAVYSRQAG